MKLIVGLGNPGHEYDNTRHNIGFSLLDYIALSKGFEFNKKKYNADYLDYQYCGEKVIFIKPLSYMNLSGNIVKKFVDFYKISFNDLLVIQDDLDMSFGKIKIVYNSSSGGHNGIKDIEKNLGTKKYSRLKIGISNDKRFDTKDYVLGKFSNSEMAILEQDFSKLVDIVDDFCKFNLEKMMSKYNNK